MNINTTAVPPFFSIIIPTFNRAHLIVETLNSVLQQSFTDFEVIVVDDCSKDFDELQNKILQLSDPRLSLIRHEQNKNGAASRNTGIKRANGEYICFLDSDDTWPLNRLELVRTNIMNLLSTPMLIFYGQVDFKYPHQSVGEIKPQKPIENQRVADYLFLHDGLIQTSTIVCKREIAQNVMFDERFRRHQDYDFCLRAEKLGYKFYFIESVLSNWLRYPEVSTFAKGATYDRCKFWLDEMEGYLGSCAINAYRAKILAPIALESGRVLTGISLCVRNIWSLPVNQIFPAMIKCAKGLAKLFLRLLK